MGFAVDGDGFIDNVTGIGHHLVVAEVSKVSARR